VQALSGTRSTMRRDAGWSMIEIMAAMTVLTLFLATVGFSLHSSSLVARDIEINYSAQTLAQQYIDQLVALNFGSVTDPDPSLEQLNEFFDADADPGTITVHQLTRSPAGDGGWLIPAPALGGTLRLQADFDIDDSEANGASAETTSERETIETVEVSDGRNEEDRNARERLETSQKVVRVRFFLDDRLVLRMNRALEAN
jgi:type II secretory pathway pseudopilin PulG